MNGWLDLSAKVGGVYLGVWVALVVLTLVEAMLYRRLRGQAFDWKSMLASIAMAGGHKVEGAVAVTLVVFQFRWVAEHRLFDIQMDAWWKTLLLFLTADFFYYWQHRLSHEIRWFWATHSVHHSAEQLTVMANYRHGWTGAATGIALLYLPVVFIGFPPNAALKMLGFIILYQVWVHTELIGRLGWLDLVFNTPSNHRVHHARNEEYLDRNYGGVLMIFDRIFGTYVPEDDKIKIEYGLLGHKGSHNPFVLAFREWGYILRDVKKAKNGRERWGYLIGKPGWKPMLPPVQEPEPERKKAA
jgi:sterol desaturase/sphingolipid hydroxylase (fatty acid hydroxylase superfamily)